LTGASKPLVGIGMPVYNGERYLAEALESICAQSYREFELVICDNASTDGTADICRRFAAADSRIRYFRNDANIGAHPNYNRSFALSRGKYFKWAPHDDVLHPDFLAECVAILESDPGAVACQAHLDYIDAQGTGLGVVSTALAGTDSESPATRFAAAILLAHNCYVVMGLFRRDVLEGSMLLESFHGADRALIAELSLRGRFREVPLPLLRVRDHAERYTRAKVRPDERAAWHDTRLKGARTFPIWRLYREYWGMVWRAPLTFGQRLGMSLRLLQWWFVNWNAARMVVGFLAAFFPALMGWAERLKQRTFSPAPGIDQVRKAR
jgi:glycosyltransferase involved in cell wall biosynthesis